MKHIKIAYFIFFLTILPFSAFCSDWPPPKWECSCTLNDIAFDISFISQSEDVSEDDMLVKIQFQDGKVVSVPVKPAWYVPRAVVSDVKNICEKVGGFKLRDDKVLLWLSHNNRPHWDLLSLVLLDLEKQRIISIKEDVGAIKDVNGRQKLAIRKKDKGFEVRLEREWLKNTGTDSAENSIEDWMLIRIINGKIVNNWSQ